MNTSSSGSDQRVAAGNGLASSQPEGFQPFWAPARGSRRPRVLYAEDDASIRRTGQIILAQGGCSVDTAADGAEAWSALLLNDYDLLITDNNMPRLTGLELIHKVASAQLEIPIIVASGSITDVVEAELRKIKCRGLVLAKPFSPQQLIAATNDALLAPRRAPTSDPGRLDGTESRGQTPPCSRWGINE